MKISYSSIIIVFTLTLFISNIFSVTEAAEKMIANQQLEDKIRGMWLGQLIGNAAGRPTEGDFQIYPNPDPCVPWVIKQTWDADDDTDIEYIAMHILEANGLDCNESDISNQWQHHIIAMGIYIANRQAWHLMGDGYLPPDTGSRAYNEHWYSIDSQITTECIGAICPGMIQQSLDLTSKFAHISNEGFPVHAAQFYAAMYAQAFFEPNVFTLVTNTMQVIPTTSRTYQVIDDVLNWYLEDINDGDPNWRQTRQKLYDDYQGACDYGRYYNWIESAINTGATVLALLYGNGDFKDTVQISVLAGWDNDCNPATAAGLIGIINGYSGLPADLTDPNICGDTYKNVYRPYLPDPNLYRPQYDTITNIASKLADLAEENILGNSGYITYDPNKTYHIPDNNTITIAPEKPDPNGPTGLVAQAQAAGITVTPTAAIQYYNTNDDRRNLYAIIDGIIDNSYNGHKAYYSYWTADPCEKSTEDWYQLNFSKPVKFDSLTFYEGDIIWYGINTYNRLDNPRGGFFEDLTVQILRDGQFIQPANLQMIPELDQYQMYQTIGFDFAPTVGDAIRIIGTPGGQLGYTTIMELEVTGDTDPGLYVQSTRVANGLEQRSTVTDIAVVFNRDVNIEANDISLTGTFNGTTIDPNQILFDYHFANRTMVLTFDIDNDSNYTDMLPDDTYELKLDCTSITDANNNTLLDDDTNPADNTYTIRFHCLFGDADGSARVDMLDLSTLCNIWLNAPAQTGLDYDADGQITLVDLAGFAENWMEHF